MCKILKWWILKGVQTKRYHGVRSSSDWRWRWRPTERWPCHQPGRDRGAAAELRPCPAWGSASPKPQRRSSQPAQLPAHLSQEGRSTVLFLGLFQPDIVECLSPWQALQWNTTTSSPELFYFCPNLPAATSSAQCSRCSFSALHSPAPSSSTRCSA